MLARKLFFFLAVIGLVSGTGCRGYCERNYPCPQPGYGAPYCPPAPAAGFGPAPVAAPAYGPPSTCTCTCR